MTLVDRACLTLVVAAVSLLHLPAARAQSAEAEVLFRDGRNLMRQGRLSEGCDKIEASARLESSVGAYLNLGDCREKQGLLAGAWAAFRKAESVAKRDGKDDKRQAEASKRAFKLEPQLSNLTIEVARGVEGLVIRRNEVALDGAIWNTPMPVDPGHYSIVAEAPGYLSWRTTIEVAGRARRAVVKVPALERAPIAHVPEVVAPPAAPEATIVTPAPTVQPVAFVTMRPSGTWSATREVSALFAVAGVGALSTGIYFGFHAQDLQDQADKRCPLTLCADSEALRLNNEAKTSATRANIFYAAGGAAIVTAVVMWLAGAPTDEVVVRPTMSDHQVGLSLAGSF